MHAFTPAGYDRTGPHLYNTCPSGNYFEYKAMAIGARSQVGWVQARVRVSMLASCNRDVASPQEHPARKCDRMACPTAACCHTHVHARAHAHAHAHTPQAAKTYLEKHYESFPSASLGELVQHGLKALAATLSEGELTKANVSIAVVGEGAPFVLLEDDDVEPYVAVRAVQWSCVCVARGGGERRALRDWPLLSLEACLWRVGCHCVAGGAGAAALTRCCCAHAYATGVCVRSCWCAQLLKAEEDAPMAGGDDQGAAGGADDDAAGGAAGAAAAGGGGGGEAAGGGAAGGAGGQGAAPMDTES
jgi:hypothetical protein